MDEFIWVPDWNAQNATTANISTVQFADGYSQRQAKGMNPLSVSWSLSFNARTDAECAAIQAFLEERYGVIAFTWTPPGKPQSKWTCTAWTPTKASINNNGITLSFILVYEP